jgi:hypothetical protein
MKKQLTIHDFYRVYVRLYDHVIKQVATGSAHSFAPG